MILPHLAAVYLAWKQKPLAAGLAAGLAFALNIKGLAVLLVCLIFAPAAWPLTARRISDPERAAAGMAGVAARVFGVSRKCLALGTCCTPARLPEIRLWRAPWCASETGSDSTPRWPSRPAGTWLRAKEIGAARADARLGRGLAGRRRRGLAILAALSQPAAAAPGDRRSARPLPAGRRNARSAAAIRSCRAAGGCAVAMLSR